MAHVLSPSRAKPRPGGLLHSQANGSPSVISGLCGIRTRSVALLALFVLTVLAGREVLVRKVHHSSEEVLSLSPTLVDDDESTTFSDEFSEFEHAFSNTPVVYKSVTSESGRRYDDAVLAVQTRKVSHGQKIPLTMPVGKRLRVLVTGGAGFVGSHLVDRLLERGDEVIVLDNFFTGQKANIAHHKSNPHFELIRHDVVEVDQIYHLACPASPVHYKFNPVKTIKTSVVGTLNMLGLAKRLQARFLLTSTSEVYGDPLEHPQTETYWGNVNPIGERSCYDEGKRTAETLTMDYHRQDGVEVRIARIFNTYGPRMALEDGRVVSNFVSQALRNEPITIYGDGSQTRSFQYVSDLVAGLMRLMDNDEHTGPFNIGNPGEFTMKELSEVVKEVVNPDAKVVFKENTPDDPGRRRPDITKAKTLLQWEPKVPLREGLPLMVEDFKKRIAIGEHHIGLANLMSRRNEEKRARQAAALGQKGGGGGAEGAGGYKTEQAED